MECSPASAAPELKDPRGTTLPPKDWGSNAVLGVKLVPPARGAGLPLDTREAEVRSAGLEQWCQEDPGTGSSRLAEEHPSAGAAESWWDPVLGWFLGTCAGGAWPPG